MSLEVCLLLQFSGRGLSGIGVSSSLNFWQNSAVKPSGPGLLSAGRFLITVSISVLVMGLLRFFHFFLVQFWKVVHFHQVVHFIGI